jgi:hypothetical protein
VTRRTTGAVVAAALLLAGCSSSGDSTDDPTPTASTSAAPVWNPCNGIEVGRVEDALGTGLTVERGTEDTPRCALVPAQEGDAVIDANYTVFAGTFEEAWEAMGAPDDGSVTSPAIPTADGARLVVDAGTKAVGVTGFVQKGPLVLIVNALDTAPYRPGRVTAAVREVMTQLAAYAPE